MRLIRLTIPSWKNLKDLTIEFDQESFTTVIVGRNGTGKSNILEALIIMALLQSVWVKNRVCWAKTPSFQGCFGFSSVRRIWHDGRMRKLRRLDDAYRFIGFRPESTVRGIFGDPKARIVRLLRRGKKRTAEPVGEVSEPSTTARPVAYATSPVATPGCTWSSRCDASLVGAAAP